MQTAIDAQAQLGLSMPAMQPTKMQQILDTIVQMKDRGSVAQVHQALKDLGPLTRSTDSKTRGIAKQLTHGLQDSLRISAPEWPETAGATQLLQQATGAWRQESAVLDLQDLVRVNGPVLKYKNGELLMNPDALMGRVEQMLTDQKRFPFFAGSLSEADRARLLADVQNFKGTPTGTLKLPPPPEPVKPELPAYTGTRASIEGLITLGGMQMGSSGMKVAGAILTYEALSYGLAKAMLSDTLRPMVLQAMKSGQFSPQLYGILGAIAAKDGVGQEQKTGEQAPALPGKTE
jgi:hypothetical protein